MFWRFPDARPRIHKSMWKWHFLKQGDLLAVNQMNQQHCTFLYDILLFILRARHATPLPRQHDHVFRPQNCWLLHYVSIRWELATTSLYRDLYIFCVTEALLRCCCFVLVLKLTNCRVPSSAYSIHRIYWCWWNKVAPY